jgi:hypothetical protein
MKNFALVCLAGAWLCFNACAHHGQQPAPGQQDSVSIKGSLTDQDSASNSFFPVADYLETEIMRVDSFPIATMKYTIRNGRTDSGYIQLTEFNALARQFLLPEFKDGSFEKKYTENSFADRGTESVTFTYSTTDQSLPLQRVDVVTASGTQGNLVKSIYLEKSRVAGDSVILQKMFWQAGRNFQIISLIRVKGQPPMQQQVRVVWNAETEEEQ